MHLSCSHQSLSLPVWSSRQAPPKFELLFETTDWSMCQVIKLLLFIFCPAIFYISYFHWTRIFITIRIGQLQNMNTCSTLANRIASKCSAANFASLFVVKHAAQTPHNARARPKPKFQNNNSSGHFLSLTRLTLHHYLQSMANWSQWSLPNQSHVISCPEFFNAL
jgi:hypothetical protein